MSPSRLAQEQALSLVAPAVLAGLVAQTLFLDHGDVRPFGTWYLAAAVAALVAWRTRSFGWTLAAGHGQRVAARGHTYDCVAHRYRSCGTNDWADGPRTAIYHCGR